MPIAEIETPDGRIIELEVPDGATEQQILQFVSTQDLSQFQAPAPQESAPAIIQGQPAMQSAQGDGFMSGAADAALEVISGINRGAMSIADMPADVVNAISQLSGSDFRAPTLRGTEIGQMGTAGGFVEDPNLRQALGMAGEFAAPGLPVAAFAARGKAPGEMIESAGDLIADIPQKYKKPANQAVKAGLGEDIVSDIAKTGGSTKRKINDMIRTARAGLKSRQFKESNRPSAIAGDSLLDRVNHIKEVNRRAGSAIDKVSERLKGKPVDVSEPISDFQDYLKREGVKIIDDGKGGLKGNFDLSELPPGDEGPINSFLKTLSIRKDKGLDAYSVHRLKRSIDRNITYGKAETKMSNDTANALGDLRRSIDSSLDSSFPMYDKANKVYKETIEALNDIQKASGSTLDLSKSSADKALGVSLRRLMGNTQSRAALSDSLDQVDSVANKYGGNFDDNLRLLSAVAEEFDSKLKTGGATAFRQQIAQAGKEAAADVAAAGSTAAAAPGAIRRLMRQGGTDPEKALDALENLIKR